MRKIEGLVLEGLGYNGVGLKLLKRKEDIIMKKTATFTEAKKNPIVVLSEQNKVIYGD